MTELITINKIYEELKLIEKNMITKEEMERMLETIEIMFNENTMEQIRQSEDDILAGRIKEVNSVDDI